MKKHYHVNIISGRVSVAPFITDSLIDALNEFASFTKLVEYTTGLIPVNTNPDKETRRLYLDGSEVRLTVCNGQCLIREENIAYSENKLSP